MKFFNTLTRQVEGFKPLHDKQVGIYTCGPTVYDQAHIGNMRTYILSDLVVRTLRFLGFDVTHVMNITDIDDKMIDRVAKEGISLSELAEKYETLFFEDIAKLGIEPANTYPRATEHYPEMKQLLNTLVEKGFAYEKADEVYFDISVFKSYGKLSRLDRRQIKPGARVKVDEYGKDDVNDFVLWKIDQVTEDHSHEPTKGAGRPGWHLECSAMSMKYLGPTLDIHIGGVDLLFPHHENEIAQSEAATEKPFVRYFIHGEHMFVDGQKMSKSLGNTYTVGDIEKRGIDPLAYRYLVLSTHYRSKLNFTWGSLEAAARTIASIRQLAFRKSDTSPEKKRATLEATTAALDNDFDTPAALALLHEANDYDLWLAFEPVLGLGLKGREEKGVPESIIELAEQRKQAKQSGNYEAADQLREQIQLQGYIIEDQGNEYTLIPSKLHDS